MKAETFFYLVARGRNSGLPRRLEVWFVELTGAFYLLADTDDGGDWIKNIQASPNVSFSIGNRRNEHSERGLTQGSTRLVDEAAETDLCAQVRALMHAKYRWSAGTIVEVLPAPD